MKFRWFKQLHAAYTKVTDDDFSIPGRLLVALAHIVELTNLNSLLSFVQCQIPGIAQFQPELNYCGFKVSVCILCFHTTDTATIRETY
ncbi:hypothetical protein M513_08974 [Trichuris suis]|uniref:Uncharacterized protein n=1 Tax=Trichuris suis TaxID=68888 RepID=A0A085LYT9_9BILA|nr:hypothetical protein M513_08974 [Trichuris suis]